MSEKGDPSVLFCWAFFCTFSCPLTCPTTPQNLAQYVLISWESKNWLSIAENHELLFTWSSFHWELEWRALVLPPYRENSGLGAAQLAWDRLCAAGGVIVEVGQPCSLPSSGAASPWLAALEGAVAMGTGSALKPSMWSAGMEAPAVLPA